MVCARWFHWLTALLAGLSAAIIHVYAQFAVYALIVLRRAAVAWHLFVRRDDMLERMLPRQSNAEQFGRPQYGAGTS